MQTYGAEFGLPNDLGADPPAEPVQSSGELCREPRRLTSVRRGLNYLPKAIGHGLVRRHPVRTRCQHHDGNGELREIPLVRKIRVRSDEDIEACFNRQCQQLAVALGGPYSLGNRLHHVAFQQSLQLSRSGLVKQNPHGGLQPPRRRPAQGSVVPALERRLGSPLETNLASLRPQGDRSTFGSAPACRERPEPHSSRRGLPTRLHLPHSTSTWLFQFTLESKPPGCITTLAAHPRERSERRVLRRVGRPVHRFHHPHLGPSAQEPS